MVKNTNQNSKQVSETFEKITYSVGGIFLVKSSSTINK